MAQTTFRRQRLSKPVALFFDNENPTNAVLQYEPMGNTARLSVYPQLSENFPDVENVQLEVISGKKAQGTLFSNGFAAWFEIENRKRFFLVLNANGDYLKSDSTDAPTGSQVLVIQSDAVGKLESWKAFPSQGNEPMPYIIHAANLFRFEKDAKPIKEADTKILAVDSKKLKHEFLATLTAPGIKFTHQGNVSEIREAGFNPDGFRFWKKASVWPTANGTAVVAQSTLGNWHVGTFDNTGALTDTQKVKSFTTALSIASSQMDRL